MLKSLFLKFKKAFFKNTERKCIHVTTDCDECMSASHCTCKDACIVKVKKGAK